LHFPTSLFLPFFLLNNFFFSQGGTSFAAYPQFLSASYSPSWQDVNFFMAPTVVFDKSASICHIEGAWQRWLAYGFIYLNRTSTHFTPPQGKTQPAHPPALTS